MPSTRGGETSDFAGVGRAEATDVGRISFLDQALWKQFNDADTLDAIAKAWLGLQCRFIIGTKQGVVVLGEPDEGPFAPVAYWPEERSDVGGLSNAAELAMAERRGIVQGEEAERPSREPQLCYAAYPFLVDKKLCGVIAIELESSSRKHLRSVMRQLQWGAGWIEVIILREQLQGGRAHLERMAAAFDLVASALEQERFRASCNAAVTELTMRLDCDQVSIGFVRRRRCKVAAVSHTAQFGRAMNLIRDIGSVMDEAIDQRAVVLYPPRNEGEYRIVRAHAELARTHDAGSILTVPLHTRGRFFGALTFERPPGSKFDEETIELCDCVASVIGPILEEKRRNDRLIVTKVVEAFWTQLKRLLGPHYFGRKLATVLAALVVGFFAVAKDEFRVTSPAVLEGAVQRVIVAPMDGYIASQHARAGQVVREGELLATLDDKDLALERLRLLTRRREHRTEYDRAMAARERAEAQIILTQIEQVEARIALLDEQLARTRLTAPFDGLVILGDLSQSVGAAVERGEELFQIAPLNAYRLILEVDEGDITDIQEGQSGTLLVSSMPDEPMSFVVERITPIAEAEEGRNFFRVEARLDEVSDRLRPGMKGVAKTSIEDRLVVLIWSDKLIDWLRLMLWKWWP